MDGRFCDLCGEVKADVQFLDLDTPVCADCLHAGAD
jgi:formylmethanofuran dehydrogenase subunit E